MNLNTVTEAVERIAKDARSQMETVTRDQRYSHEHKQKEVMRIRQDALNSLNEFATIQREGLQSEISTLKLKVSAALAPSSEQVPILLYQREKLAAKWRIMNIREFYDDFAAAVKTRDEITARLYLDFGYAQLVKMQRELMRKATTPIVSSAPHPDDEKLPPSTQWLELVAQAEEMLMPPDQLKARKQLAQLEQDQGKMGLAIGINTVTIQDLSYDPRTGQLAERLGKQNLYQL